MSDDSSGQEKREASLRRHWWGFGAGILIIYAFFGPVLRYVSAEGNVVIGLLAAVVLFTGYWFAIYWPDRDAKAMFIVHLASLGGFGAIVTPILYRAEIESQVNDLRCIAVQKDMLSAHPRREDSHDLFQALGCQPQGYGWVYAPPTDREKKAGHPLPWGGYPPSR